MQQVRRCLQGSWLSCYRTCECVIKCRKSKNFVRVNQLKYCRSGCFCKGVHTCQVPAKSSNWLLYECSLRSFCLILWQFPETVNIKAAIMYCTVRYLQTAEKRSLLLGNGDPNSVQTCDLNALQFCVRAAKCDNKSIFISQQCHYYY